MRLLVLVLQLSTLCLVTSMALAADGPSVVESVQAEAIKTNLLVAPPSVNGTELESQVAQPVRPTPVVIPAIESPSIPPTSLPVDLDRLPPPTQFNSVNAPVAAFGATRGSYSAVPSMIGDTTAGGCGVVRFDGGLPVISVAHPTFACSRLNIAENNSASIRDRFYVSYRHFRNASSVSVFADSENGGESTPNIDRLTFGMEKRLGERSSVEVRVPINYQLSSDLAFSQRTGPVVGEAPLISLPLNNLDTSLGNIAVILKRSLLERDGAVLSGGLAVNLPTAPDVHLSGLIDDDRFVIEDPNNINPDVITPVDFFFDSTIRNRLVSISPFTSFAAEFGENWFVQGFAQLDVPITPLVGSIDAQLSLPNFGLTLPRVTESGDIEVQKIGRLSLGIGRYLYRSGAGQFTKSLSIMSELHYTTTLEDASLVEVEVLPSVGTLIPATTVQIGNVANRTDVLDLVFGVPIAYDSWRITNGIVAPLRMDADRGFDFEYNLMVGREF